MTTKKFIDPIEQQALLKISELITKMHSFLLPRASTTSVYRDLNDDEEHLLENLNPQSVIHSILAGCLAIDSCQQNIYESEEILKTGIMKSLLAIIAGYQSIQSILEYPKQQRVNRVMYDGFTFMYHYLQQLSTSNKNNEEILKKIKYGIQQKSLKNFSINSKQVTPHIPPLNFSSEQDEQLSRILLENRRLKEKLSIAQSKLIQMQVKLMKTAQNKVIVGSSEQQNDLQSYNPSDDNHQPQSDILPNAKQPQATLSATQKQIKRQRLLIDQLRFENRTLYTEHYKEKKQLMGEIEKLEDQIQFYEKNNDQELMLLIEDLEMEIEHLRLERRKDERIILSIQDKFQHMRVSRNIRERNSIRGSRRGSDLNLTANYEMNPLRKSLVTQKYGNPQGFRSHQGLFYKDSIHDPYAEIQQIQKIRQIRTQRSNSKKHSPSRYSNSPRFNTEINHNYNNTRKLPFRKKNLEVPQNTTPLKSTAIKQKVHFDQTFMPQQQSHRNQMLRRNMRGEDL